MDNQSLQQKLAPLLTTQGAYVRLFRIADKLSHPREVRLEAAFLLIEKCMREQNLE